MTTHPAAELPELLPCPFCGMDVTGDEGCFPIGNVWEVRCGNPGCFAHEPSDASRSLAIRRWNRRRVALARQPKAEAVAGVTSDGRLMYLRSWLQSDRHVSLPAGTKLYLAPPQPQPSVDLELFREAVTFYLDISNQWADMTRSDIHRAKYESRSLESRRLLSLIDAQREKV